MLSIGINLFVTRKRSYPPVLDKLLVWAKGGLQDGNSVVFDENVPFDDSSPFGIYRRDYYKSPGDFPMRLSGSHCATFDGVADTVLLSEVAVGEGDYFAEIEIAPWDGTQSVIFSTGAWQVDGWYIRVESATSLRILFNTTGNSTVAYIPVDDIETVSSLQIILVNGVGLTYNVTVIVNGVTRSESQHDMVEATTEMVVGSNTQQDQYFFKGKIWNVRMPNESFPISQGYGTVVHCDDGSHFGTVTSNDVAAFWGGTQDTFHFNVVNGYWTINEDPTKYPFPIDGFDEFHPPGTWNGAETLNSATEDGTLIVADALGLGPFLFDAGGNSVSRSQDELRTFAETSDSLFMCKRYGKYELRKYNEELVGQELIEADAWCLTDYDTWIDEDGNIWTDGNENIYVSEVA